MRVADAIAFAHSRGVIHRDVKPENVMLGGFGEVLVMDWGIALSTSSFQKAGSITPSGGMGGTPAYMAPEMVTGPLSAIQDHSDVYLLGAVLLEIITSQPPHTGTDVLECLRAAARNEIVPSSKSGELLEIAYRALSTRPQDRFASVQEFQAAIRQYQSHSESIVLSELAAENLSQARQTQNYQDFARAVFGFQEALAIWDENLVAQSGLSSSKFDYARTAHKKGDYDLALSLLDTNDPEQARLRREIEKARDERTARQRRLKTARRTVLALAALVLLVVTGALITVIRSNEQTKQALKQEKIATEVAVKAEEKAVEAKELTVEALVQEEKAKRVAQREREDAEAARRNAEEAEAKAVVAQQKAEEASYVAQIGLAAERIDNNAFSDASRLLNAYEVPDLAHYRNWEWGHLQYLCQLDRETKKADARVESMACSDDGRWLVAGTSDGHACVWDRQSGERLEPFAHSSTPVLAVAISQDGRIVVSGGEKSGDIQVWERDDKIFRLHESRLVGHSSNSGSSVFSLRFFAHGTKLLSASADGTARLWDWRERRELYAFRGHAGPVYAASVDPDGTHVVTASEDGTVRVWPIPELTSSQTKPNDGPEIKDQRLRFIGHQGAVYAADFAPDGRWVAAAGRDGRILIWDWRMASAAVRQSAPQDDRSEEVILTAEGGQVQVFRFESLEADLNGEIRDSTIDQPVVEIGLRVLRGHSAEVRSLAFSKRFEGREGNFLVSCGHDNTVKVWNLDEPQDSAEPVVTFRGHGGWARSAFFLPDDSENSLVASGGYDGQVKIWDSKTYEDVRVLPSQKSAIADSSLSADGRRAITAGRDGIAHLWDVASGRRMYALRDTNHLVAGDDQGGSLLDEGHEFLVSGAIFFPESPRLLTSAGDGTVRLWNYKTGGQLRSFEPTGPNASMTLADNGRWLLTGGQRNEAYLWDVENSREPLATLEGHRYEVTALAISPGGELEQRMLFTGDANGTCQLWQWNTQNECWESVRELDGHLRGQPITAASFLPDGRHLLTASQDYTVMRWDVPSGKLLIDLTLKHPGGVRAMDVSSDGARAVTVCQNAAATSGQSADIDAYRLSLWNLEDSKLLGSQTSQKITSIALNHDDRSALFVADAGSGGQLFRWEFESDQYRPLWNDRIRPGAVWAVATSSEPGEIVTVGGSHARLWQEDDGELVQSLSPHGPLNSASFSPSGKLAVTASRDGAVKIWNVEEQNPHGRVVWKIPVAHGEAGAPRAVNSAIFGPRPADGDAYLLTAGDDGTARLWRLGEGVEPKLLSTLSDHKGAVRQAVFSHDGHQIATASSDGTARIWDASDPTHVTMARLISGEGTQALGWRCIDFAPDGSRLVIGGEDNTAQIWNLRDMERSILLEGHAASLTSVAFSPDGMRVVSGSSDGIARVWDADSGQPLLSGSSGLSVLW